MKKTKNLLIALLIPAAFDVYACQLYVETGSWTEEQCQEEIDFYNQQIEERRKWQEEARQRMEENGESHSPKIYEQDICTSNAYAAFADIMGMKSIAGVLYFTHENETCENFKLITRYPTERLCNSFSEFSKLVPPSADAIADCERAKQCNYDFCK